MSKNCLFDNKKVCTDCGECNTCDIVDGKICDNCGKCLEFEGIDTKATRLSDLMEKQEGAEDIIKDIESNYDEDVENSELFDDYKDEEGMDIMDNEENWVYIDDLDDVSEILNDPSLRSKAVDECYPGLLKFKSKE